jgi:hypothetical protein
MIDDGTPSPDLLRKSTSPRKRGEVNQIRSAAKPIQSEFIAI